MKIVLALIALAGSVGLTLTTWMGESSLYL